MGAVREVVERMAGPARDARRHVLAIADVLERAGIRIPVRLWDGTEVGSGPFRLVLHHPWSLRSLLVPPTDLNAGEAYVDGDVDIEGDVVSAVHAVAANRTGVLSTGDQLRVAGHLLRLPVPPPRRLDRAARLTGERHSLARDRDAVRFHYDLGNDFFALFLDEDLVYSCAVYDDQEAADPVASLASAQRRKLDVVCRRLRLGAGDRFLDVGCGWGSLVMHAARTHGVEATGTTLSARQAALARERVQRAGLGDRVTILERDYRELDGRWDAVASIGMVEHVGSDHLGEYFATLRRLLADGGRLLNQGITTGARRTNRDLTTDEDSFVAHYVFPDGGLVPAWRTVREVEEVGLEVHGLHQLRRHYALTLRAWISRLEEAHDEAVRVASETDYRIWRIYMAASVVGFETDDLGVTQVLAGVDWDRPLADAGVVGADGP